MHSLDSQNEALNGLMLKALVQERHHRLLLALPTAYTERCVWPSTCSQREQQQQPAQATSVKRSPFKQEAAGKVTFGLPSSHPSPSSPKSCPALWLTLEGTCTERDSENIARSTGGTWFKKAHLD